MTDRLCLSDLLPLALFMQRIHLYPSITSIHPGIFLFLIYLDLNGFDILISSTDVRLKRSDTRIVATQQQFI